MRTEKEKGISKKNRSEKRGRARRQLKRRKE